MLKMLNKVNYILMLLYVCCYAENNEIESLDAQLIKLFDAINKRDTSYIYTHIFEDVQTGFDADGMGIVSFKEQWNLLTTSEVDWNMLLKITKSGWRLAIYEGDSVLEFPSINILCDDSTTNIDKDFILFDNTLVFDKPNGNKIFSINHTVVKMLKSEKEWYYIQFKDGKKGYIHHKAMYHCYGLRMCLQKDKNVWKIKSLLAGA